MEGSIKNRNSPAYETPALVARFSAWISSLSGSRPIILWLAIFSVPYVCQISSDWYPTWDASGYLSLARSIAVSHWPTNLGREQLFYPPGYPLLISPAFAFSESPFLLLSLINCGLGLLFILGVHVWARRLFPLGALALTALAVWNVDVLALFRRSLTEAVFMPLLVWSVIVLQTRAAKPNAAKRWIVSGSSLVVFLAMVKPAGIFVAAGFGIMALVEAWRGAISWRRALWTTLAVGLPATIVLIGLILYDRDMARQAGAITYVDHLRDSRFTLPEQLEEGVRLRISEFGRLLIPGMFKAYGQNWLDTNLLLYLPLFFALLAGWWRLVRIKLDVLALLFPFYLALYIVWPFDQATRFFAPLLPLLAACLWFALEPLAAYRHRIFVVLAVLHVAVALGFWLVLDRPRTRRQNENWPLVRSLAEPIQKDAGALAVIDAPENMGLLFQYALDRPVRELKGNGDLDPRIKWIATPIHESIPADFTQRRVVGDFQLLHRKQ